MWADEIISRLDVRSASAGAPSVRRREAACTSEQVSVLCQGLHVNLPCGEHQAPWSRAGAGAMLPEMVHCSAICLQGADGHVVHNSRSMSNVQVWAHG